MNKKIFLTIFMSYMTSNIIYAQTKKLPAQILGNYVAYKCFPLPVNEIADIDARKLLGGKLVIGENYLVLFDDTLKEVTYTFEQSDKLDFFQAYRHFDYRKLKIQEDTIDVLSATPKSVTKPSMDIIVTKEKFLVAEYKSYFFLFRKAAKK
ncbi:hypothetical protein ACTHGU_09455 [Chitinophagaceae bacterium MMS25-I14]